MIKLTKKRKASEGVIKSTKRTQVETIPFYEIGRVEYMHVSVDLEHEDLSDLVVKLRNPKGVEVLLHNRAKTESTQLSGVYGQQELAPFIGNELRGNWTLIVEDQVGEREGILYSWSIGLDYTSTKGATTPPATIEIDNSPEQISESVEAEVMEPAIDIQPAEPIIETEVTISEEVVAEGSEAAPVELPEVTEDEVATTPITEADAPQLEKVSFADLGIEEATDEVAELTEIAVESSEEEAVEEMATNIESSEVVEETTTSEEEPQTEEAVELVEEVAEIEIAAEEGTETTESVAEVEEPSATLETEVPKLAATIEGEIAETTSVVTEEAEGAPTNGVGHVEAEAISTEATALVEEAIALNIEETPQEEIETEEAVNGEAVIEEEVVENNTEESPTSTEDETPSSLDQIIAEVETGNGSIIALEDNQIVAIVGGKKVNLGTIQANLDNAGKLNLELKQ